MENRFERLLVAAPDALTSALFLCAWFTPNLIGPAYAKNLMLTMLIEFIVMHSSGFYAGLATSTAPRSQRIAALCALTAFYLLFIVGFSLAFHSVWPIIAFGWLFVSRFAHVWANNGDAQIGQAMALWVGSAVTYVIGAIVTVVLPLPALGLTNDFVASMHLSGSGEWIDRPQTVMAFGAIYFAIQSAMKYGFAKVGTFLDGISRQRAS